MRILSLCPLGYYNNARAVSYEYLSFVEVPRAMGHTVHQLDPVLGAAANKQAFNEQIVHLARTGGYDFIFSNLFDDEFILDALDEVRKHTPLVFWNSDDDWRWESYTSKYAPHCTWMITTYRHIYEANRAAHPHLLLSQWGCTGFTDGEGVAKDIDISFVGAAYGERTAQVELLKRNFKTHAQGKGFLPPPKSNATRVRWALQRMLGVPITDPDLELKDQDAVKGIWNRSRISFTPLDASKKGSLQIKGRVFDQGLSLSLMLATRNEALHEYYAPDKEYVEFATMDECVEKARFYLANESARRAIAEAYRRRTQGEHLFRHRFEKLYREMGFAKP